MASAFKPEILDALDLEGAVRFVQARGSSVMQAMSETTALITGRPIAITSVRFEGLDKTESIVDLAIICALNLAVFKILEVSAICERALTFGKPEPDLTLSIP